MNPVPAKVTLLLWQCPTCGNTQQGLPDTIAYCFGPERRRHKTVKMTPVGSSPN